MSEKKTVGQSTASLVLGIISLLMIWMLGVLAAIPAVICGHVAKSKIAADPENLQGNGQALAGLIMGYISIGVTTLAIAAAVIIPLMSGNKDRAAATEAQAGCSTIYTAERIHMAENGTYIDAETPEILPGINKGDLQGTYFDHNGYVTMLTDDRSLIITATANGTDGIVGDVILTVTDRGVPEWSGSLLE